MQICNYINCHRASIGKTMKIFTDNDEYRVISLNTCNEEYHYKMAHDSEPNRKDMEKYFSWDRKDERKLFQKPAGHNHNLTMKVAEENKGVL